MADKAERKVAKANETGEDVVDVAQVEHIVAVETRQGFRGGAEVDTTPNENYTVAGVIAGKPTPETDEDAAAAVGSPKRFHI